MPKAKPIILFCFMLIIGLFISGCSKSDESNHEAIKKVLEQEFTGPDEELMELMWNPEYRTVVNNQEENKKLDKYLEEKYGPYFTDSGLHSFIAAFGGTQYQTFAHNAGYNLSFKDVKIEQDEKNSNLYTFAARVGYKKGEEKEKTANVKGEVRLSEKEEGKIETFKYGNDDGFLDTLRK